MKSAIQYKWIELNIEIYLNVCRSCLQGCNIEASNVSEIIPITLEHSETTHNANVTALKCQ